MTEPQVITIRERMLELLMDGEPHTREDMLTCIDDELATLDVMRVHISNLRKSIEPRGMTVQCMLIKGKTYYRLVRLLHSSQDGYR